MTDYTIHPIPLVKFESPKAKITYNFNFSQTTIVTNYVWYIEGTRENIIVDAAVLDLPSICINVETTRLVKSELGLPSGFAPSNAIYGWEFVKKFGISSRCGAIASLMTYCADAGSYFILFGGVKFAKCIVPSIALISGINSYYRKRILREKISEKTPMKLIF